MKHGTTPPPDCRASLRRNGCGQSSIEYIIVLMLVVIVLIDAGSDPASPVAQVVQAIKDVFGGYAWAISFSNNLNLF